MYLMVSSILFSLSSCVKEDYSLTCGDVFGNIRPEGVIITFSRGDKNFETVSGNNGSFILNNLETGIYDISFAKNGYFTYKTFGFQFLGGPAKKYINTPGNLDTLMISTSAKVKLNSIDVIGKMLNINITSTINPDFGIRFFISDKPGVSLSNHIYTGIGGKISGNDYGLLLDQQIFQNLSVIYITGYIITSSTWQHYFDWEEMIPVYPITDNPSNELKFNIPKGIFNK